MKLKNTNLIKIRLFLGLLVLAAILAFLLARLVPSGRIFYNRDFSRAYQFFGGQGFIGQFTPRERLDLSVKNGAKLVADPVYFSLFTPRSFTTAHFVITYQDNLDQTTPVVEAGVLMDKVVWQYQMKPVVNKILDNLGWPLLRSAGVSLYDRTGKIGDPAYFIKTAATRSDLALYNYPLSRDYYLSDYSSSQATRLVAAGLRGPYQFYTYIDKEPLNFTFFFQDLNQNYDLKGDGLTLVVSNRQGQTVFARELRDDGIIEDNAKVSAQNVLAFSLKDLSRGVYRIELKSNDDIVTKKITSSQTKITFINKIWLEDETAPALELYTNVNNIKATAFGPSGEQTVFFNGQALFVNAPYQQFYKRLKNGTLDLNLINLRPPGIIVENNGLFAFSPAAFINPDFIKIDNNWEANRGTNYILAVYQTPVNQGQDKVASLDFDLSLAYREKNKYSFMISIPGLYAVNQARAARGEAPANLVIKNIRIELVGKSLSEKLSEEWRLKIWPRLKRFK